MAFLELPGKKVDCRNETSVRNDPGLKPGGKRSSAWREEYKAKRRGAFSFLFPTVGANNEKSKQMGTQMSGLP